LWLFPGRKVPAFFNLVVVDKFGIRPLDPLAYWQKLTEKAGIGSKVDSVEPTLLLATTRGLLLDLCATGDRARVGRAMEALAQFVEWRVTPTKMMGREPKELNGG
jgi:hypothetical protein